MTWQTCSVCGKDNLHPVCAECMEKANAGGDGHSIEDCKRRGADMARRFGPTWSTERDDMLTKPDNLPPEMVARAISASRMLLGQSLAMGRGPSPTVIAFRRDMEVLIAASERWLKRNYPAHAQIPPGMWICERCNGAPLLLEEACPGCRMRST